MAETHIALRHVFVETFQLFSIRSLSVFVQQGFPWRDWIALDVIVAQ